ncbi:MAG: Thiamine-monophosphate kinase, partial [Alphaproteobacteria bacterium]|nr:Thiamine-monophosphate kinase [Alphaproteobacteria bacterium]
MDEFGIIARYFAPLAGAGGLGLTDDAAILPQRAGHDLVVTTDAIAEGVDFFGFDPAATIAQKALRVNLSDLAAKGAEPAHYLLNLSLPHTVTPGWLAGFAQGLAEDQQRFGITLLGGDTSATDGALAISVTAFGYVPQGGMIRRSGARAGDHVYVTGTIGDSGGGLAIFRREKHALTEEQRDFLIARYRVPQPPVTFAAPLRDIASASVDISDGLIADLGHIASASKLRIVVEGAHVPLSDPLRALWGGAALLRAVAAGDDYQIAFTAAPGLTGPFTPIGHVAAGEGVSLMIN